jgi:hypothetical protein
MAISHARSKSYYRCSGVILGNSLLYRMRIELEFTKLCANAHVHVGEADGRRQTSIGVEAQMDHPMQ